MTSLPTLLLSFLALLGPQGTPDPGPPAPFERLDYGAAQAKATELDRLLMVVLVEPASKETTKLREVWGDDAVNRWIEVELVAIEVDGVAESGLMATLGVETLPTTLILEPTGELLDSVEGALKPHRFVKLIKGVLELRELMAALRPELAERPEDPELHYRLATAFVDVGRLGPAVESYDAAWNFGRGEGLFERIRTGQMLNEFGRLTGHYPPAKKAMVRWKRAAMEVLEAPPAPSASGAEEGEPPATGSEGGVGSEAEAEAPSRPTLADQITAAKELSSLNQVARDDKGALALYKKMQARGELPHEVLEVLFDKQVVGIYYNQKRYDVLERGFGDVFQRTDQHFRDLEYWRRRDREGTIPPGEEPILMVLSNALCSRTAMYFEMLLALEREGEAMDMLDLVLLREPSSHAFTSMMRGARRAGRGQLSKDIADRGLIALTDKELVAFEEQVELFFKKRER